MPGLDFASVPLIYILRIAFYNECDKNVSIIMQFFLLPIGGLVQQENGAERIMRQDL